MTLAITIRHEIEIYFKLNFECLNKITIESFVVFTVVDFIVDDNWSNLFKRNAIATKVVEVMK